MQTAKQSLRMRIQAALKELPEVKRQQGSEQAKTLLERQAVWLAARKILFYAPLPGELDIWPLFEDAIRAGKEVYLPRYIGNAYAAGLVREPDADLTVGRFGIREPRDTCAQIALNRLDFVLVPGVAFNLQGRRLGRGKGYYDRLLAEVRGKTCGVGFNEQIVEDLPVEPHDIHLNCILTPTRWIEL